MRVVKVWLVMWIDLSEKFRLVDWRGDCKIISCRLLDFISDLEGSHLMLHSFTDALAHLLTDIRRAKGGI